jgi:predicted ATPase/class 3 adenylate cyclase
MAAPLDISTEFASANVCMLFTDIEGSTNLVDTYEDLYDQMLFRHNELLRNAIHTYGGEEVNVVGDSIFALFPASAQGVQAAIDAQVALTNEEWVRGCKLRVRMGLHSGKIRRHANNVVGIEVHRAARIGSVAHGGQIVISNVVRDDIKKSPLRSDVEIRDLGFHRLKDLRYPEALFDLVVPGLPSEFAPISSVGSNRTNLPVDLAPLYGRTAEMARFDEIIAGKQRRLVTISGPGGVGKSSMAIAAGRRAINSFFRGVFLVQLRDINTADLICSEICKAIAIQEVPGVTAIDTICNSIGDASVLLILDTFEHVIDGAQIVEELIKRCQELVIVVTSREPLKLRSETEISLSPLPVPAEDDSFEKIQKNSSVQLFVNLVGRERPDFALSSDNAGPVARICRRLEGLPLALELAASHFGVLGPQELEVRLENSMQHILHKSRGVDPRHRTLRLLIEWSENLLTDAQRSVFRAVSIFNGGFDLPAAEFLFPEDPQVIDHLEALLDKNLLFRTSGLERPRLNMLDTIREFADDRLRHSDKYKSLRRLHARYFADLVAASSPNVMRFNQRDFVEHLMQEAGNIRSALEWLTQESSAAESAKLVDAMKWLWISRGYFSEARRWADEVLIQARKCGEPRPLAGILSSASLIRYMSGDPSTARDYGAESYALFTSLEDQRGLASSGIVTGIAKATTGDLEGGAGLIVESLERSQEIGDDYGAVLALIALGEGTRAEGDEVAAESFYNDALARLEKLGDTYWPGHLLQNLAHFRLHSGNWPAAAQFACQALAIGEKYDYPMVVNLAVAAISGVLAAKGDWETAAFVVGAVEKRLARLGVSFEPTDGADFQRIISAVRGQLGEERFLAESTKGAAAHWDDILRLSRSVVSANELTN